VTQAQPQRSSSIDFNQLKKTEVDSDTDLGKWLTEKRKQGEVNLYKVGDAYLLELKGEGKPKIQFYDQIGNKWRLVPDEKLGGFYQNKERLTEQEKNKMGTVNTTQTETRPVTSNSGNKTKTDTAATVTRESGNSKIDSESNSATGSFNSSSADTNSRNSNTADRFSLDASRNSHNVTDNSDNRDQSRNSHNVDNSDNSKYIDKSDRRRIDKSIRIKIGRINLRNQEGSGHVASGRDSKRSDKASTRNSTESSSADDNSIKSWKSKKASSASTVVEGEAAKTQKVKGKKPKAKKAKVDKAQAENAQPEKAQAVPENNTSLLRTKAHALVA
jgi:hypothetical protein